MIDSITKSDQQNTQMLMLPGPSNYDNQFITDVNNWFNNPGPRLLWLAGDSDFGGYFLPDIANDLLNSLDSQLRLSADAIDDPIINDGTSYRVISNQPVTGGSMNTPITQGVDSAAFHAPASVLGVDDFGGVVDLRYQNLNNVEIIMKSSDSATALDQDFTQTNWDYYTQDGIATGNYPLMAIESLGYNKYIIVSGEVIFSNYKNMYDLLSEKAYMDSVDAWGAHQGKILVDNVVDWFGNQNTPPDLTSNFDMAYLEQYFTQDWKTIENLTRTINSMGGQVDRYNQYPTEGHEFAIVTDLDAIFDLSDINNYVNWFESSGPKLLWVAGDSDFSGYFISGDDSSGSNGLLKSLNSRLRLSSESIEDTVANDGTAYQVVFTNPIRYGDFSPIFTQNVNNIIGHGPTAVMGIIDGVPVDLRDDSINGIEVIIVSSDSAVVIDSDLSQGEYDFYSQIGAEGNYPFVAIEDMGNDKYIIVSGEAIFSDYKNMYGLNSEKGSSGWGPHQGQIFVDNILNWYRDIQNQPVGPNIDITSPIDQTFREGSTGKSIEWMITGDNPDYYEVYQDNDLIERGGWASGTTVKLNIDNLKEGNYIFNIFVFDDNGNNKGDNVTITVLARSESNETTSKIDDLDSTLAPNPLPLSINMILVSLIVIPIIRKAIKKT